MIVTKVIIFTHAGYMSTFLQLGHVILETLSSSHFPPLSFLQTFLQTTIPIFIWLTETLKKKRERENHVAIIFHGIHNDTRKYINIRRKRCKESFSNERFPAWSSRHRSESTKRQHGHKNSRDIFANNLDTKSYFHPRNSWIKVELRVTKMEKKRCQMGDIFFSRFIRKPLDVCRHL